MDEFKIISAPDQVTFNDLLKQHTKDGWLPYGELCANVSVAKSDYSSHTERMFSVMLIRKFNKKET